MLLSLRDRRVATPARPEPVTRRVKCRLPDRLERLPHRLTHHPVGHVRESPTRAARRPPSGSSPDGSRQADSSLPAARQPASAPTIGHCSCSASTVCPSGPGAPLFYTTLESAIRQPIRNLLHRHRRPGIHIDDRLRHTARPDPSRTGPGPSCGVLLSRSAGKAEPPFHRPGPPSLAHQTAGWTGITPPSGTTRSSDFCWAIEPSSSRSPTYRAHQQQAGTQQISRDKTQRFRRDHVANTPSGPTGTGHRCREPAHPPKARLTALHSRSQPQRTYGFLQTRPHGSPRSSNTPHWGPPGEPRAAPLPLQCWVPPARAPGQDFHLRSPTSCPAYSARPTGSPPRRPPQPQASTLRRV